MSSARTREDEYEEFDKDCNDSKRIRGEVSFFLLSFFPTLQSNNINKIIYIFL